MLVGSAISNLYCISTVVKPGRLQQLGMDPVLACGDEFDRQIAAETAHWSQLARQLKINDE